MPGTTQQDWTTPGAHPVSPGVHRIPLPLPHDGLRAVNVYAVEDGDALTLVDGGWALAESERALEAALAGIGRDVREVRRVLVTHVHRDHYTQAVALRRRVGASVSLGTGERPAVTAILGRSGERLPQQVTLLRRAGAGPVADAVAAHDPGPLDLDDWQPPDTWLDDGTDVALAGRTLRAVATPGHTRGHLVFHDAAAGLLFAGDHVLPHITPSIGFEPLPGRSPLADYMVSLALVRALPDALLLPAHGAVAGPVHERVDALLAHHEERLDATFLALAAGATTAYEVARILTWTRRGRAFDDLDVFNQMLATLETAAHLELLVDRAVVTSTTDDPEGVRRYLTA
ncbi:MBL fold metallo-hydrolase [Kineosporia sp. R_H_3]|uniref:MBL fold metallo-hydrolase n=1 Tax=Kineosporia sp. R_H_3 TaxID=1961848 RepID=UPI000B4B3541|nr:MBL fold metallo-hydrolase [Kineosporia sp. R_H_3]